MKTEKLFELLTLINGVKSKKWATVMQLVDEISKENVTIKDKQWNDGWKQSNPEFYPLDLNKIETWSTYDLTCIDLQFSNDISKDNGQPNNQLICKAKIYEGDSLEGERQQLRFKALLYLPTAFIHTIEQRIKLAFETYLEEAYENHLEAQKDLWINNMRSEIINR